MHDLTETEIDTITGGLFQNPSPFPSPFPPTFPWPDPFPGPTFPVPTEPWLS